jgi:hypothetical protein
MNRGATPSTTWGGPGIGAGATIIGGGTGTPILTFTSTPLQATEDHKSMNNVIDFFMASSLTYL